MFFAANGSTRFDSGGGTNQNLRIMSCEICGKSSCTRSFHSLEEQDNFDEIADEVKARAQHQIEYRLDRLEYTEIEGELYIKLSDAIEVVHRFL